MFPFSMHNDNNTTMFSFGSQSSPFDEVVEKATAETLLEENWGLMMDISDKVSMEGQKACKQVILSIKKRLNNRDPHVVIYALSLLDCLWKNAGTEFRRSVSSKDFVPELRDKSISSINAVAIKTCKILKEWSENECSKDPSLALISSLYKELNDQGLFFENNEPKKTKPVFSTDPNVVSSAEEEAQLAQAIAASLNEVSIKKTPSSTSQYPTSQYPSLTQPSQSNNIPPPSYREVKALYDFEAAEENELNMKAGDSVMVLEDSDANWWKGQSHRGVGLFPSSFVTGDLSDNNAVDYTNGTVDTPLEEPPVQIDEEALLKCIQLLEECDLTGETPDPPALAYFENMALQMAPLIDKKLANIDRQHNMLANVDIAMRDVLASYDQAVQQVQIPQLPSMYNNFPQQGYGMPGAATSRFPQQINQQPPGQFPPQQRYYQPMENPVYFPNNPQGNFPPSQQPPTPAPHFVHPRQQTIANEVQSTQETAIPKQENLFLNHVANNQSGSSQQFGYSSPFPQSPQPISQMQSQQQPIPQQQFQQQNPQQSIQQQQPTPGADFVHPQQQTIGIQHIQQQSVTSKPENQNAEGQNGFTQNFVHPSPIPQLPSQQPVSQQQPIAAAHFVHPQQQTNGIQQTQENVNPKPENQVLNHVPESVPTQQSGYSSPLSQQPPAPHFVHPRQQTITNEVQSTQATASSKPEDQLSKQGANNQNDSTENFIDLSPILQPQPQQQVPQQQPIAAARFVHPQQQTNEIQNVQQHSVTSKPENQNAEGQNGSTQNFVHSSPIPQQPVSQQQSVAAARFVHPQQQTIEIQNVQENVTPVTPNQFINQAIDENGQNNSQVGFSSPLPLQQQQPAAAHFVYPQQQTNEIQHVPEVVSQTSEI
uniref:Signal transducing adapter molecule 1 n=2 Tax=Panagrolaimus sp. PS1159 TaxID=55785 RepID=A0AC35FRL9_9BILA